MALLFSVKSSIYSSSTHRTCPTCLNTAYLFLPESYSEDFGPASKEDRALFFGEILTLSAHNTLID